MTALSKFFAPFYLLPALVFAANQTPVLTPIASESALPFSIKIETMALQLPSGLHSGAFGTYQDWWIFIAGSHMGLHGFGPDPFPIVFQNATVYIINPKTGAIYSRSLHETNSGLTSQQVDDLSVISPQFYQSNHTLYMTGGYGYDTASLSFTTKPLLTALYLPGIVQWVMEGEKSRHTFSENMRQLRNSVFQITGGDMYPLKGVTNLVFGQQFTDVYTPSSNGLYSRQVRRFKIKEISNQLAVEIYDPKPAIPDINYRRRDLNILPTFLTVNNHLQYGLIAFGGVFTPSSGVWTVPVVINENGQPTMANPDDATTFKQGMNQYVTAAANLYSRKFQSAYHILLGGISYGFYQNGQFLTDSEIPFINQVTTIKMDKNGHFSQYLMNNQYPVIISTDVNPGNPLLFGAGAYFIPSTILKYPNGVISLDTIRKPTVIGYIAGGIQSTVPNTSTDADSSASRYIFKVTLSPKQ